MRVRVRVRVRDRADGAGLIPTVTVTLTLTGQVSMEGVNSILAITTDLIKVRGPSCGAAVLVLGESRARMADSALTWYDGAQVQDPGVSGEGVLPGVRASETPIAI